MVAMEALRKARAQMRAHSEWVTAGHPLNRYPKGHPLYRPRGRQPCNPRKAEAAWYDAVHAFFPLWESSATPANDTKPGTLALWHMLARIAIPVQIVRRNGRDRNGMDWVVERLDDPYPAPRQTPIPGWIMPAVPRALYRAEWSHLRVVDAELATLLREYAPEDARIREERSRAENPPLRLPHDLWKHAD